MKKPSKTSLAKIPFLRPIVLRTLKFFGRPIWVENPWSHTPICLHSFWHKSYWYLGKERERKSMEMFSNFIQFGSTVIEVGGHIGYVTQYFSRLVGDTGKVICFEPGLNNRKYIEKNLKNFHNVTLDYSAVSNEDGFTTFYEDNATGQNNSLMSNYETAESTAQSHLVTLQRMENRVEVVKIDTYVSKNNISPDFMKIDVEGYDLYALIGAKETLKNLKAMMIEVTYDHVEIEKILLENFSIMWNESGKKIQHIDINYIGNIFASK